MTPEEREIIGRFIARVGGASPPLAFPTGGLPATTPPLPPVDPEADRFIGELFATHPEARYRITQMAFVQEAALAEAQNRIKRLEWDITQAKRAQPAPAPAQSRGLFGGLFGGAAQPAPAPAYTPPAYAPPPGASAASYPPGYQQGMFGRGGSGFLGSALTTAAGVAGGVLAADAISSMFAGHSYGGGFGGGFGGGGFGGGEVINETVVNNYGDAASADPWAGAGTADTAASDPWGGSGAADAPAADWSDPGAADQSFDSGDQGGSFDDGGGFDGGGSDDSGSF